MSKRIKPRKQPKRHYDVEMIRDFLSHLRWEYAINHLENTHELGVLNPELSEQLARYQQKWNTVSLMAMVMFKEEDVSKSERKRALEIYRDMKAKHAQAILDALDVLEPSIERALQCASPGYRDKCRVEKVSARDILRQAES